jgi:ketosteroid isomerase-like protein
MSEQDNTRVVQQAYQGFQAGDIPAILALMSETIEWRLPEIENVPFSGLRHGREGAGQFFASLAEHQDALRFEPREFVAQGDKVVVLGHYAWKVKRTGRTFECPFVHVFTLQDGRVAAFHEYMDTARAAAAYR